MDKIDKNMGTAQELQDMSFTWIGLFRTCHRPTDVTLYMHILQNHVPELKLRHQNLSLFSLQGLEKLNDITTLQYHRQTNKHKYQKLRNQIALEPDATELHINIEIHGDIVEDGQEGGVDDDLADLPIFMETDPAQQPNHPAQQPNNPAQQPNNPAQQPNHPSLFHPAQQPNNPAQQPNNPAQQPNHPAQLPNHPPQQPNPPHSLHANEAAYLDQMLNLRNRIDLGFENNPDKL